MTPINKLLRSVHHPGDYSEPNQISRFEGVPESTITKEMYKPAAQTSYLP